MTRANDVGQKKNRLFKNGTGNKMRQMYSKIFLLNRAKTLNTIDKANRRRF